MAFIEMDFASGGGVTQSGFFDLPLSVTSESAFVGSNAEIYQYSLDGTTYCTTPITKKINSANPNWSMNCCGKFLIKYGTNKEYDTTFEVRSESDADVVELTSITDLIGNLSSYSNDKGTLTAFGGERYSTQFWRVFDGTTSRSTLSESWHCNYDNPHVTFEFNQSVALKKVIWRPFSNGSSYTDNKITILGANLSDFSDSTTLTTKEYPTSYPISSQYDLGQPYEFDVSNNSKYKYYRVQYYVTSAQGVGNLKFFGN